MSEVTHMQPNMASVAATITRTVLVRYFASVREAMGKDQQTWPSRATTLQALREELRAQGEPWASALAEHLPIRMALNQMLAKPDTPLPESGDIEVAFFPPVTGG